MTNKHKSRGQRGAVALPVAMLLLFGMTFVAFFVNRGLLFEQRTSANQFRSTVAFEAAEAGLEWFVARLNDPKLVAAAPSCLTTGTVTANPVADRLLGLTATGFTINSNLRVGCSLPTAGQPACGCPAAGDPVLGSKDDPRFTVRLAAVAGDPWSVEVQSYGCSNAASNGDACSPTLGGTDAIAFVSAIYKMKPSFPQAPGAGLVTGAVASLSTGSFTVVNTDVASNGITINSGSAVELGSAIKVISLPGTPPRASVLDNDPSLANLNALDPTGELFFSSFFGETLSQYQNSPLTWSLVPPQSGTEPGCGANTNCTACSNSNNCATALVSAMQKGFYKFWSGADMSVQASDFSSLPGGTMGTAAKPIAIASSKNLSIGSNVTAFGLFYAQSGDVWDFGGSGTAQVNGAFVSRSDFSISGGLDLVYNANLFGPGQTRGLMIRVPGSWRDKTTFY